MSDVNLNSSDLTPRPGSNAGGEQRPARASSSPSAEGTDRNDQGATRRSSGSGGSQGAPVLKPVASAQGGQTRPESLQPDSEALREDLDEAVSRLNDFVQSVQRDLEFEVDDDSGRTVVRVIDQQTDEVVRQIPDELALRLAENLQQDEPLNLLNIRV